MPGGGISCRPDNNPQAPSSVAAGTEHPSPGSEGPVSETCLDGGILSGCKGDKIPVCLSGGIAAEEDFHRAFDGRDLPETVMPGREYHRPTEQGSDIRMKQRLEQIRTRRREHTPSGPKKDRQKQTGRKKVFFGGPNPLPYVV